jgi:hypothetical protein
MFQNDPNITKYDEGVFVYRNFVDKETVDKITSIADEIVFGKDGISADNRNPWYRDKYTPEIPELFEVWKNVSELLHPSHVMHPMLNLIVMKPGEEMFVHEDSPGEHGHDDLTVEDKWSSCCFLDYGVIVYFGNWTGGNVFYPEIGLEVDPRPGDLVIHGATSRWKHGVRPVESGVRYAYSNFSLQANKNPGSFYNYKTKEFEEQTSTSLDEWKKPLFENIREYKAFEG